MGNHYYFAASLPLLSYESRAALEPAQFLTNATPHLTANELRAVADARIEGPKRIDVGSAVGNAYARFERGLRNALVRLRATGLGVDPEEMLRRDESGRDESDLPGVAETARQAYAEESALAAEDLLNRARWTYLDSLETGHYFDTDLLVVYYLRLQILARRALFHRDVGEAKYNETIREITNDYYQEHDQS